MHRRRYLAALLAGSSGCLTRSRTETPSPERSEPSTGTRTGTTTETSTETPTPDPIDCSPVLTRPDSEPQSRSEVADAIHAVDPASVADTDVIATLPEPPDEPVVLSAEPTVATLPAAVTCTVANRSDEQFSFGPTDWTLWRWEDDRWFPIGPVRNTPVVDAIQPGETHEWTFELSSSARPMLFLAANEHSYSVGSIGPGVYALSIEGGFAPPTEPAGTVEGDSVTAVAVFGLAGDPLTIEPEPAVVKDGVVGVPGDGDGELRIERTDSAEATAVLEQLAQPGPLRAGVPYLCCENSPDEVVVEIAEFGAGEILEYVESTVNSTDIELVGAQRAVALS